MDKDYVGSNLRKRIKTVSFALKEMESPIVPWAYPAGTEKERRGLILQPAQP